MAGKPNIRSIRFSDELAELIDRQPWFAIVAFFIAMTTDKCICGLFSLKAQFYLHDITDWLYSLFALLFIYSIGWNIVQAVKGLIARRSSGEAEELERQREAERREIDMVRKSNDILLHLIQDEHREEGDR